MNQNPVKNSFWENIFRRNEKLEDLKDLLKKLPIFEMLTKREIDAVEKIIYQRDYAADEIIFLQGEPGLGMYIVQKGVVIISAEQTSQVLVELRPGDFFGEVALLNETPRSATARAKTACTLISIFQPDMLDLVQRNTRLGVKVLLSLAKMTSQRLVQLSDEAEQLRIENAQMLARVGSTSDETM